jgi:uncharacterized protein
VILDFPPETWALAVLMGFGAALYTSVGHAGASAYLALMALFGLPAQVMRPTALSLNILAGSLAAFRYHRAGYFSARTLWPFLVGAAPMAFVGGYLTLPAHHYRPLVGVVLLAAAIRLLWPGTFKPLREPGTVPIITGIASGAAIGLLSGLTGTGGGIFLSPLLLLFGWSTPRTASGVAVVFILVNSIAGLSGNIASVQSLPAQLPLFALFVLIGTLVGTQLGIKQFANEMILKALGLVLIIAGLKMIGLY